MSSPINRPFAPIRLRGLIVSGLLIVDGIVALLGMITAVARSFLLTTDLEKLGEDPISLILVMATFILVLGQLALLVITAIFFLTFLYRAHENLPALGTPKERLQYSAGWAVGSFFVPFASLVIPYRAVKEVWQLSQPIPDNVPGVSGYQADPPFYFGVWWLFWLAANIGNNLIFRLGDVPGEQNSLPFPLLSALVHAFEIAAALCLIFVVNSISRRQAETWAQVGHQLVGGPPPPPQFGPAPTLDSAARSS